MRKIFIAIPISTLIAIIFLTFFYDLGRLPFQIWDESRLATSAYEMVRSGELLVTTVDYKPDMWSTKPPLMIWAQALTIKILGMSEFAVRLPSALAAAATVILLFVVVFHVTANVWAGLLAGIVLCTSVGYIGYHGVRFGEYDSLLTLLTTVYLLLFFFHIEHADNHFKNALVLGFFFFLALAVLTKGIAGLLFCPALLLYAIFRGQVFTTLCNKYVWIGTLGFVTLLAGYYLLREHFNPGYLNAVQENELGGRFAKTSDNHAMKPMSFYFLSLISWKFPFWFGLLCASIIVTPFIRNSRWRWLSLFCLISASIFICVLSLSATKLEWYHIPVFPLLAISIAIAFAQVTEWIHFLLPSISNRLTGAVLILATSIYPLAKAQDQITGRGVYDPDEPGIYGVLGFYNISEFLREALLTGKNLDGLVYLTSSPYDLHLQLYLRQLKDRWDTTISRHKLSAMPDLNVGAKVLVHEDDVKNFLKTNYDLKVLEQDRSVLICEIVSRKEQPL